MDNEQILKLVNAGYTKAEIDAMQAGDNAGGQTDKGAGEEDQTKGKDEGNAGAENAGKIAENAGKVEDVGQFAGVNAAIEKLTNSVTTLQATVKKLQTANVKGAETKTPAGDAIKAAMDSFIEKL